jgi:predicted nucleotidyltransferase
MRPRWTQEYGDRVGNLMTVKSRMKPQQEAETPGYYTARSQAVAAIAQRQGLDLVVLFGSATRGQLRRESDVDVAVRFVPGPPGFEAEARVAGELHQALRPPRELDLVVLNGASPLLLAEVAAEGVVLYAASPEVWPLFRLYARKRFEDTEKYRQRRWEALKR